MKNTHSFVRSTLLAVSIALVGFAATAQEATIRKNLSERMPEFKKIDEVTKTDMPGIYEVRVDSSLFYTDEKGTYLLQGELMDVNQRRNITQERMDKINAVAFDSLPLKDAFTVVRGNGKRKVAVFEDPNCGYCKRFEKDLQNVDNVTVHMFLYPILGADSADKTRALWCAKDRAAAWQDWMVRDQAPPSAAAMCDTSALARNVELGRAYKITGTPTLVFVNGSRVPGAIDAKQVEKHLAEAQP